MQEQLIEFDRSPDRVHDEWQVLVQHCRYAWNYLSGLLARADTAAAATAAGNIVPTPDDVTTEGPFFTQLEDVLSGEVFCAALLVLASLSKTVGIENV